MGDHICIFAWNALKQLHVMSAIICRANVGMMNKQVWCSSMAEQVAVNHKVEGSSPSTTANLKEVKYGSYRL